MSQGCNARGLDVAELSILELGRVREGFTRADALNDARRLGQHAETWGYKRLWVAEHHNMRAVTTAATSLVVSHIAAGTKTLRVGAGGIMLPNHTPFQIAEQFGTLDALFPGRIDLGLGRAPGAGPELQRALRKDLHRAAEMFPQDVVELMAFMAGETTIHPTPGLGAKPEFWMLGSSLFGAQLAAKLGMPYAFASHFAPDHLDGALELYRRDFQPSEAWEKPHVMAAMNLFVADTQDEAEYLASSQLQAFVSLRTGKPGKLPPPVRDYRGSLPSQAQAMLAHIGQASATGTPQQAADTVRAFIDRTGADEIIFGGSMYDPQARNRSLELAMDALGS